MPVPSALPLSLRAVAWGAQLCSVVVLPPLVRAGDTDWLIRRSNMLLRLPSAIAHCCCLARAGALQKKVRCRHDLKAASRTTAIELQVLMMHA